MKKVRNQHRKIEDKRIHFGKYAGKLYSEVPTQYLEWFVANAYHQMVNRKQWAIEELNRRRLQALNDEESSSVVEHSHQGEGCNSVHKSNHALVRIQPFLPS